METSVSREGFGSTCFMIKCHTIIGIHLGLTDVVFEASDLFLRLLHKFPNLIDFSFQQKLQHIHQV